ncbi:PREDICTED: UDP-glucuronosyltransferase 2B1-like [Rhagoletis zephyria]|uniref:UDP-glucuronosyltransferase 2B1-like n=1 Tax=Rhagoletis zephyria TaxID=28612 RepID=UPI0008112AD8|nr:PREDICTED: UDP-glucuronosyltransferase 2B1-like [Rhagoletis zephyria]
MTINKLQGQTMSVCGLDLGTPCFSYGQLYVACSRGSKILICLLALAALAAQAPSVSGAKILAVHIFPGRSHYQMHRPMISELVKHGHQVTMITGLTLEPLKLGSNYTEILIEPEYDIWKLVSEITGSKSNVELETRLSLFFKVMKSMAVETSEHALKQPKVQAIINAKQTEGVFDLLLVEQLQQEVFLALAHVYKVPVVSLVTFAKTTYMSQMFGVISPWSYVPMGLLQFTERMSFWERAENALDALRVDLDREFVYFPVIDKLVEKYFGHLPIKFPSTSAMEKNLSAMFVNNYTPLAAAAPTMDNMVNIGGIHISPPKPLPTDLQTFLDEAEYGVIYFSFGTQVKTKDIPLEKLQIFIDVFRQLKQRVLWKFDNDSFPNLPANVMIKKWLPQNDILAHPNVRTFLSHGGLFGLQEAVYHGVPLLGMPFFFDQRTNLNKAQSAGYAITMDFRTFTHKSLTQGLEEVLYNPKYRDTAKRFSRIFRDRPASPRETFLYWIDYVIRHNGARHLRAAGMDLKWYQFYLLDVAALVVAAVLVAVGVSVLALRWLLKRIKGANSKQKVS